MNNDYVKGILLKNSANIPGTVEIYDGTSMVPRDTAWRCALHVNCAREAYRATLLNVYVFSTKYFGLGRCNIDNI